MCEGLGFGTERGKVGKVHGLSQFDLNKMTYLFLEGSERLMKMGIEILIDTLTNFEDN